MRELRVPGFFLSVLLLALAGAAADQALAPVLFSTAPLFAVLACLLLALRRGSSLLEAQRVPSSPLTLPRVLLFLGSHATLIALVRTVSPSWTSSSGALTPGGWGFLVVKLCTLAPALLVLPWRTWRLLGRLYAPEFVAGLVVLVSFFPRRIVEALWPWYGQFLGHLAYWFAWPFVSGLTYAKALYPTLTAPMLDVTILLSCSGITGIELFDALFAVVVVCDWPRLNKRRTLTAYVAGIGAMFFSNALRIASFVVLGNHGFANFVTRFHVDAGWLFFSAVFLLFLCSTYPWLLTQSPRLHLPHGHRVGLSVRSIQSGL
jgi:exosortase/archaeosortase family protein